MCECSVVKFILKSQRFIILVLVIVDTNTLYIDCSKPARKLMLKAPKLKYLVVESQRLITVVYVFKNQFRRPYIYPLALFLYLICKNATYRISLSHFLLLSFNLLLVYLNILPLYSWPFQRKSSMSFYLLGLNLDV